MDAIETIQDAERAIFEYFCGNTVYDPAKDFDKILTISIEKDKHAAIIEEAMKSFIERKMVVKVEKGKKVWYVLVRPMDTFSQLIEIHKPTITALASIINPVCLKNGEKGQMVNPLEVSERDIQNLIILFQKLQHS